MVEWLLIGLPSFLALLLAGWLSWPLWRDWQQGRVLERRISALGDKHLQNVMLDDGMGGESYFEWLLLTTEGICPLITRRYTGNIFAGDRLEQWAQVQGSRSRHFVNPLHDLEPLTATLRYHFPKIPLRPVVLFTEACHFPKGRPEVVLTRADLPTTATPRHIPLAVQQAWVQLEKMVRKPDPLAEAHLLPYRESVGRWRLLLAGAVLLMVGGWTGWQVWAAL